MLIVSIRLQENDKKSAKKQMVEANKSLREWAKMCGVSASYLSSVLTGKKTIRFDKWISFTRLLDSVK